MLHFLLFLLVGWPAILVTVVLAVIGLIKNNYRFLLAASFLSFPFSWALSGLPLVAVPACLNSFLPLLLFASSFAMFRGREMIAWLLGVPFFLAILMLFYIISAQ